MAVNIRKFVARPDAARRAGRGRHAHRAGRPLPRGLGRRRAEHPRRRRHAGRARPRCSTRCAARSPAASGWSPSRRSSSSAAAARRGRACRPASRTSRGPARSRCGGWSRRRCGCARPGSIVGEVRQEECLDLLIALNSGLPGMCTLHANSAREALVKMCTLPLLAGENVSAAFVVPTVAASRRPRRAPRHRRVRRAPGPRDRRRHRAGRGRRHRDDRPVRVAARPARARSTATRLSRSGTRLPAST